MFLRDEVLYSVSDYNFFKANRFVVKAHFILKMNVKAVVRSFVYTQPGTCIIKYYGLVIYGKLTDFVVS
jgi:hypothetical protein